MTDFSKQIALGGLGFVGLLGSFWVLMNYAEGHPLMTFASCMVGVLALVALLTSAHHPSDW